MKEMWMTYHRDCGHKSVSVDTDRNPFLWKATIRICARGPKSVYVMQAKIRIRGCKPTSASVDAHPHLYMWMRAKIRFRGREPKYVSVDTNQNTY